MATAQEVAAYRESIGLDPDPASDQIWADRIASGQATLSEARSRINNKMLQERFGNRSSSPYNGTSTSETGGGGTSTGGGTTNEPEQPSINYRDYAPAWMSGQLLDIFTEHWDRTGDPNLAMEAVRRSSAYDQVFVGNRREDGSLRYNEQQYMSTRDSFRDTMREFQAGDLDDSTIEGLFVNNVSANEFFRGVGEAYQSFTEPGGDTPQALMREFLSGFTSTGSAEAGWAAARDSDAYDQVFQGNRRDDGTLIFDEQEYFGYKRGWQRTLVGFGLNPGEFESRGRFVKAVENEVSIQELQGRLQLAQDEVLDKAPSISTWYAENYGLDLSPEAILGMFIDPDIERDVLQRRAQASQIGGEAAIRGFTRSLDRAESLARSGVSQQQARDLYGQAQANLGSLSATTQRFNRGRTSLEQFEEASALGDVEGQQRLQRALRREQSTFGTRADTRRSQDGFGLTGLRQR